MCCPTSDPNPADTVRQTVPGEGKSDQEEDAVEEESDEEDESGGEQDKMEDYSDPEEEDEEGEDEEEAQVWCVLGLLKQAPDKRARSKSSVSMCHSPPLELPSQTVHCVANYSLVDRGQTLEQCGGFCSRIRVANEEPVPRA